MQGQIQFFKLFIYLLYIQNNKSPSMSAYCSPSVCVSTCLSVCLYLSVYLYSMSLCVSLLFNMSVYLYVSVCLFFSLSAYCFPSVCSSVCLPVCLCMSAHLYVSVCLSTCMSLSVNESFKELYLTFHLNSALLREAPLTVLLSSLLQSVCLCASGSLYASACV